MSTDSPSPQIAPPTNTPCEYPVIMGQRTEQYINLIHKIGLPWALLGALVWYVMPYAKTALNKIDEVTIGVNTLNEHARTAMPMLEKVSAAIPTLEEVERNQRRLRPGVEAGN